MGGVRTYEYERADALRSELSKYLTEHSIPEDLSVELAGVFAADYQVFDLSEEPVGRKLILQSARWVIRDDDLGFCEALSQGIVAAAAAGFFVASADRKSVVSACVGIAAVAFRLLRNATRKGARLGAREVKVLSILHSSSRPLSHLQLLRALKSDGDHSWTEPELLRELERLGKVRLHDGSVAAMVLQDGDRRWSTSAV